MFRILVFVGSLFFMLSGHAQKNFLVEGEKMPDYKFANLINYQKSSASFTSLQRKITILDFWGEGCVSCINSWPKLMELQDKYKTELRILLISPEDDSLDVKKIIRRQQKIQGKPLNIPNSSGDWGITELFNYESVPHIVWIDEKGIIRSKTNTVSETFINEALVGTFPESMWKIKPVPLAHEQPLYIGGNGGLPIAFYNQSIFAKSLPGLRKGFGIQADSVNGYFIYCNATISEMYKIAYSNRFDEEDNIPIRLAPAQIEWTMQDSARYLPGYTEDNSITYQQISPGTSGEEMAANMREDLRRSVGLDARWEKRKRNCLVLSTTDTNAINYKSGEYERTIWEKGRPTFQLNRLTVASFIYGLMENIGHKELPIIDETGFKGLLGFIPGGLKVDIDVNDYSKIDSVLSKFGMHLRYEERDVDILVIREPQGFIFRQHLPTEQQQLELKKSLETIAIEQAAYENKWSLYTELAINYVNTYLKTENSVKKNHYLQEFIYNPAISDSTSLKQAEKWSKDMLGEYPDYANININYTYLLMKMKRWKNALMQLKLSEEYTKRINDGKSTPEILFLYKKINLHLKPRTSK